VNIPLPFLLLYSHCEWKLASSSQVSWQLPFWGQTSKQKNHQQAVQRLPGSHLRSLKFRLKGVFPFSLNWLLPFLVSPLPCKWNLQSCLAGQSWWMMKLFHAGNDLYAASQALFVPNGFCIWLIFPIQNKK